MMDIPEQEPMTAEEKKRDLYLRQKQLLDTFLKHGAISQAQYDKPPRGPGYEDGDWTWYDVEERIIPLHLLLQ